MKRIRRFIRKDIEIRQVETNRKNIMDTLQLAHVVVKWREMHITAINNLDPVVIWINTPSECIPSGISLPPTARSNGMRPKPSPRPITNCSIERKPEDRDVKSGIFVLQTHGMWNVGEGEKAGE